ncbi:MAG TPA: hypothetical protein VLA74_12345 [Nitrososphaeraceae archaeon]|nr:hypothetical protein [Nitrososphaeraceae archaeon]
MNITNNKSTVLNNSFTSNTQQNNEDKICNALGCYQLANTEITLTVGAKLLTIFVCEICKSKFKDNHI